MYAKRVETVSTPEHDPLDCSSARGGKPHLVGWFCEFCSIQPIKGETYSSDLHWQHLQRCSMLYIGTFGKNKEARLLARNLFVSAINDLDGWALKQTQRAEKGKAKAQVVKKPKLIATTAKGKARAKVQEPTLVRYPVNKQPRPVSNRRTRSLQPQASTSGNSQSHFAPTALGDTNSAAATSASDVTMHEPASSDTVTGLASLSQSAGMVRPALQPPGLPTPNPSPSPSLSSLIRQPEGSQTSHAAGQQTMQLDAGASQRDRSAYIDLTGDRIVDIKPDISASGTILSATSDDNQPPIPGLPPYLRPFSRYFRLGGLAYGRDLLHLKTSQIVKYVERLHSRSVGTEHEMLALMQVDMEDGLARFLAAGD